MGFLKEIWQRWSLYAKAVGVVQTRGIMVFLYIFIAVPTGILMRMSGDRLRLKHPSDGNWVPHDHQAQSIEAARRQF